MLPTLQPITVSFVNIKMQKKNQQLLIEFAGIHTNDNDLPE